MTNYICGSEVNIKLIVDELYEAYKRCIEDKNFRKEGSVYMADVVNIPAIVNAAFACELYLKSMQNNNITTHKLNTLYGRLKKEDKKYIKDNVENKLKEEDKSFEEILGGLSGSFEFWRYVHEKDDLGKLGFQDTVKYMPILLEAIKECANKKTCLA